MPISATRLFEFMESKSSNTIKRHVIESADFSTLRRSLRWMILRLCESNEGDAEDFINRLRSLISEWLTVPVPFDKQLFLTSVELWERTALESRWGRDFRGYYDNAYRAAQQLIMQENPMRTELQNIIHQLQNTQERFHILCHRRSRKHFLSLCESDRVLPLLDGVFLHSVADYRVTEPFVTLIKVGPLRSRGWGAAPDAILTAPRYDTLTQFVWSGCADELGFGYDPVRATLNDADEYSGQGPDNERAVSKLQIKWQVTECRTVDRATGWHDDSSDIDEFNLFCELNRKMDLVRAVLIHVNEDYGILYPLHSQVLSWDPISKSVETRLPGETLLEGMFIIIPVLDDAGLAGIQAEDGHYSTIWKNKLRAEHLRDPAELENRLWDAGLELLNLRERITYWCKTPSTVIHAPQRISHFKILIKALNIEFNSAQPSQESKAAWWQVAWDEVRRSRSEAIQSGVQEQLIVDEQALIELNALHPEIGSRTNQPMFQISIPPTRTLRGVFRFYQVLGIEEGFQAPAGELRILCELAGIDQWRV